MLQTYKHWKHELITTLLGEAEDTLKQGDKLEAIEEAMTKIDVYSYVTRLNKKFREEQIRMNKKVFNEMLEDFINEMYPLGISIANGRDSYIEFINNKYTD